ncbi:hypothetical protein DAPPUDRAFT_303927 [Daphnia pulex]|uniref:EGF-like domain-containing protein n=1 Tax=Daphnia pulex TaxID=6669 RepID=E9GIG6_DAPPU|nr:hypothetical protein DAPPUDRAFT_303927 [Daphnia pulex]|eukprot:EFX80769.1 hypothetical protein DAPPUDRAFT_303927 [Daphnia pulex]
MSLKTILMCLSFTLVAGSILKHDDLVIAVGDQLEILANGSESRTLTLDSYNASKLSALSYDATTKKLFFSDRRHRHGHIFSVKLDNESRQNPVEDIVEKNNNETVEGLAYDPVDQMLLWTDGFNRSIRRVQINHDGIHVEENAAVEVVHFLNSEEKPRGLVVDPCTRKMYWTNRNMSRPTIERSHLDGSRREILIEDDLLLPNALDLDVPEQMLYWANNHRNGYFRIERSFVNGTARQEIYRGIGQFIVSLTVGSYYVYWSDYDHKNVWSLPKDGSSKNPIILRKFTQPAMGLVVFRHEPLNCSNKSLSAEVDQSIDQSDLSIHEQSPFQPDYDVADLCLGFCYNNGECVHVNSDLRCSCPVGFSGERCELASEKSVAWRECDTIVDEHSRAEITSLICLTAICIILLVVVVILSVQLMKLTNGKQLRVFKRRVFKHRPDKTENSMLVEDLENCCNSFTLCERSCPQQQDLNSAAKANSWKDGGRDCATLLKCEY